MVKYAWTNSQNLYNWQTWILTCYTSQIIWWGCCSFSCFHLKCQAFSEDCSLLTNHHLSSFFSARSLHHGPSAKGWNNGAARVHKFWSWKAVGSIFPLPITMSHLILIMMSYVAVERYTSVKWNERFDMGFWHGTLWRFEKLCFLSCRKRPGCCGPPLWQVIMEFGRFLTKDQFYLWSFLSGPFVVTLQCFSCTIPSSLLLCIQAFL